ncbi:ATP-binding protein [bacterium]|nr:ATP-binding protein [bacterium]
MYFVGRNKEISQITSALAADRNVILRGKYGIGRSTLVRHIADLLKLVRSFWFLDLNDTPDQLCRKILAEICPEEKKKNLHQGYKSLRKSLCEVGARSAQKVVLVLDNVDMLTPARLDFFHFLAMPDIFSFIVIVDDSMDQKDRELMRAVLQLTCRVSLSYLGKREVQQYFKYYAQKYHWDWSQTEIERQSRLTRGYPLFMARRVLAGMNSNSENVSSIVEMQRP